MEKTDQYTEFLQKQLQEGDAIPVVWAEYRFCPPRRWRFDYCLPVQRIAIEVEGGVWNRGRHVMPTGYLNDLEKYNMATLKGWRLLRCTPQQQYTDEFVNLIRETIKQSKRKEDGNMMM